MNKNSKIEFINLLFGVFHAVLFLALYLHGSHLGFDYLMFFFIFAGYYEIENQKINNYEIDE